MVDPDGLDLRLSNSKTREASKLRRIVEVERKSWRYDLKRLVAEESEDRQG
jgi:hypothetical protein